MFKKLKEFWANPYMAPLTQPLKNIGRYAVMPIADFIDTIKNGIENSEGKGFVRSVLSEFFGYEPDGHTKWIARSGVIIGCLAAFAGAGLMAFTGGAGLVLSGIAAVAAGGVGLIAGPFIMAGLTAIGGAVVGAVIGGVPGIIDGGVSAYRHHQNLKMQAAAVQAVPQLAAATPEQQQDAWGMMQAIGAMPEQAQAAVIKHLNELYVGKQGGLGNPARIQKAIEALPEADRKTLLLSLRDKLTQAFEAVAEADASENMELYKPVVAGSALKFRKDGASRPA